MAVKVNSRKVFTRALKDGGLFDKINAVQSKYFSSEYMDIALNGKYVSVRREAISTKHFNTYCCIRYTDSIYKDIGNEYSIIDFDDL